MKIVLFLFVLITGSAVRGQSVAKVPDSVRKIIDEYNGLNRTENPPPGKAVLSDDELIKAKLIKLALKNPQMVAANANAEIAEIARKKAGSSLLSSINVGGNINEFVIQNTAAASFYPKYNLGLTVPFDIFARSKAEKKTADQTIIINNAQKQLIESNIKARVLIQYEYYKEKKQMVELQKIGMEDDLAAYERAQKDFKEDAITIEELNRIYKVSIAEKALLAAKEMDFNIAVIQMEEIIGIPLAVALQK